MDVKYPTKYRYLQQAKRVGINTPTTLFLSLKDCQSDDLATVLEVFVAENKSTHYIVRSCVEGEDGSAESFAGHFASSEKTTVSDLLETVRAYAEKNLEIQREIFPEGTMNLMVQNFIEGDMGGVIFSRWKYFAHHLVGEVSLGGAEKSVSGEDSDCFLIAKETSFSDVTTIPDLPTKSLKEIVLSCEKLFDFPLDIEWISKGGLVSVVQVRPVTRPIQALRVATTKEVVAEKEFLNEREVVMDAFSESFGVLSPLSFSIVHDNFLAALPTFQQLGFRADDFNFLWRARNGQIYVDPLARTNFFNFRSFASPFWQIINEAKFKKKITTFVTTALDDDFDYSRLKEIFQHWQIANFYAAQGKSDIRAFSLPGEYEVLNFLDIEFPVLASEMTWSDWRNYYKQWWLYELDKLTQKIMKTPLLAFSSFDEIGSVSVGNLIKKYQTELPYSVLDYPATFEKNVPIQKATTVVKGAGVTARVFIIKNPKCFRGTFPQGVILVAPYFENDWVRQIDQLAGIVLEGGGLLSHSAIVAREKKIPYYINWWGAVEGFEDQEFFEFS